MTHPLTDPFLAALQFRIHLHVKELDLLSMVAMMNLVVRVVPASNALDLSVL
jgi:hypothetical protein